MTVPVWLWWALCWAVPTGWVLWLIAATKSNRNAAEADWWRARWLRLMDYHDELWDLLCDPDTPRDDIEKKMRDLPW